MSAGRLMARTALSFLLFLALASNFPAGNAQAQMRGPGGARGPLAVPAEFEQTADPGDEEGQARLLQRLQAVADQGGPNAFRALQQMRQIAVDLADFNKALTISRQQLTLQLLPPQRHTVLVGMVAMHSLLHQLSEAKSSLRELEQNMEDLRATRRWAQNKDWWQAGLAKARAQYETQAGHLEAAEQAWQACITAIRAAADSTPDREDQALVIDCHRGLLGVLMSTGQMAAASQVAAQLRFSADRISSIRNRPAILNRVNQALAQLAIEQGRFDQAEAIIGTALKAIEGSGAGSSLLILVLRKQQAELEMLRNRWSQALAIHRQREADSRGYGAARGNRGVYSVEFAYTLVRMGQAQEAVTMMRRIVSVRSGLFDENALSLWEARAFLGVALAAAGERDEALQLLNTAVPRVLEIARGERSSTEAGVLRTARFNWMLDGYINLLAEQARAGDAQALDQAFRMADLARGSTVQRALSAFAQRAGISDPELATLARREQDQQREISNLSDAIGNLLARGRIAEQDRIVTDMRASLSRLRAEHAASQAEIQRRFPNYSSLLNPQPVGIDAVQKLLRAGEAMVSVYTGSERTLVWAIPARGKPGFAVVPLDATQVDARVVQLRASLDPEAESSGRMPRYPFDTAYELYRQLLAPVESGWKGASELIVIPHGRLGQLPFGVLTTSPFRAPAAKLAYAEMADAPWLLKQVAISQLPAAIALPLLRGAKPQRAELPFVGFGDPVFTQAAASSGATRGTSGLQRRSGVAAGGPAAPRAAAEEAPTEIDFKLLSALPETADEIGEVAQVLGATPARDIYLRLRASEAQVKKARLAPYRVVMFATHGLMGGDLPGLHQPALALSNPALSGDGEDGLLTMEEILNLKLNADWVVLSACNTAAAGGAAQEAVSGLGRAFFYAGAKSLLVTGWAVETESARMLTTEAFRRQVADPTLSRAMALRLSSLALMGKTAAGAFSYAHPMFWAPYMLVGDGG